MWFTIHTPPEQATRCQHFCCKPVCLGSVSVSVSKGGGGGGGKSVSSPSAVDPFVATVVSTDDRAVSNVVEGAEGSGPGRWPSG